MHITRVEPFYVDWGRNKSAWVRIWTDSGLYGLGEASPMAQGNASLEIIASACAPLLIGADPLAFSCLAQWGGNQNAIRRPHQAQGRT